MRSRIFSSGLLGTLAAVATGALVAVGLAQMISDAVKGQRALLERDEMSEFTIFVKNLLSADASCNAVLAGRSFKPGAVSELSIGPVGYEDRPAADIQKDFVFGAKKLKVAGLFIEDKGLAAVPFSVSIPDKAGRPRQVPVNRHFARVRLQLARVGRAGAQRERYFEIPVLVDSGNVIRACNNELNLGDACQALGLTWDGGASCSPQTACLSGGSYVTGVGGLFGDFGAVANPVTGSQSCPQEYSAVPSGVINIRQICSKGCDFLTYQTVVQCLRCPR